MPGNLFYVQKLTFHNTFHFLLVPYYTKPVTWMDLWTFLQHPCLDERKWPQPACERLEEMKIISLLLRGDMDIGEGHHPLWGHIWGPDVNQQVGEFAKTESMNNEDHSLWNIGLQSVTLQLADFEVFVKVD